MSHSVQMKWIKIMIIAALFSFMLVNSATFVHAETQAKPDKAETTQSNNLFKPEKPSNNDGAFKDTMSGWEVVWTFIKVVLALALIVVLIYVLIRFLSRKSGNFDSPRKLRIVAGIGLSPQKSLQIVEVGNKLYIIGVGNDVQVLDKLEQPDEIAALIESLDSSVMDSTLISTWKDKMMLWFKKKDVTSEELDIEEYEKLFSTQLKNASSRQDSQDVWTDENKERSNES